MSWDAGLSVSVGVRTRHAASVVMTLFDVLFAWLALAAVTEETFVPLAWPVFAFTVRVRPLLDAPGANVTFGELSVDALKLVVLLSLLLRLNVSLAHIAESLFLIVRVYTALPPSVEIV
jgi:hypothetical protein